MYALQSDCLNSSNASGMRSTSLEIANLKMDLTSSVNVSFTPLLVDFIPANLPDSLVNFMDIGLIVYLLGVCVQ